MSCMFEVSVTDDEHGRWALRNVTRGYYLGAAGDKLVCSAKVPTEAELWTVHLAARPQVSSGFSLTTRVSLEFASAAIRVAIAIVFS